jgi:hypothetical protein
MARSQAVSTAQAGSSPFYAGKNKFINGDFNIWQRGTSFTTSDAYTADRWISNADVSFTTSRQTFTPGTAPVSGYEGQYYLRFARSAGGTYGTGAYQKIEDVRTLAGQTVTLSFWAKADATVTIAPYYNQVFGSGGSTGVGAAIGSGVTLTTSWTRYSMTFTLPSISGKTIGTSSYLEIYTIRYIGSSATTIDLWGVQLEAGSVATAFQTATGTLAGELAACQRYYYRQSPSAIYANFGWGNAETTGTVNVQFYLPVTMRTAPTSLETSAMSTFLYQTGGTSGTTPTTITMNANQTTANLALLQMSKTTSFTVGAMYLLGANNTSTAYLGVSAEL